MNDQRKLITIGITAFNEKEFLLEAWNSVVNQTDNKWEAIMILDGGADIETQEIFESISHNSLKKIKLEKNKGPYFTRTLAIENTTTDWYCQLDADDSLPPEAISKINSTIEKADPALDYIWGKCLYFNKDLFFTRENKDIEFEKLCYTLPITGTSPIKIDLYNRLNGYCDELYDGGADWEFWIGAVESKAKGNYIDDIIYERRVRNKSVGDNWLHKRHKVAKLLIKRHPLFFSDQNRKNSCLSKSYELSAREYKRIGNRKKASFLAEKAIEFGNQKQNLENIIQEGKMSFWRYKLRRLGRLL